MYVEAGACCEEAVNLVRRPERGIEKSMCGQMNGGRCAGRKEFSRKTIWDLDQPSCQTPVETAGLYRSSCADTAVGIRGRLYGAR